MGPSKTWRRVLIGCRQFAIPALLAGTIASGCQSEEMTSQSGGALSTPKAKDSAVTNDSSLPTSVVSSPSVAETSNTSTPAQPSIRQVSAEALGVTWRPQCPVNHSELRAISVPYRTLDGAERTGELVVHESVAEGVRAIFEELFAIAYPITTVETALSRGGNDDQLMADDVTSGFNCRYVEGTQRWSKHAYGRAIDVNPFENPWVRSGTRVDPPEAAIFVDRSLDDPRIIQAGSQVVEIFHRHGWSWGGDWADPDYQHFEHEVS